MSQYKSIENAVLKVLSYDWKDIYILISIKVIAYFVDTFLPYFLQSHNFFKTFII